VDTVAEEALAVKAVMNVAVEPPVGMEPLVDVEPTT
jgi:hypothetical protein